MSDLQRDVEEQVFAVLPGLVIDAGRVARVTLELEGARLQTSGSVLRSRGHVRGIPTHVRAGDVLLIRPSVVHRSGAPRPGATHRRTLHAGSAPVRALPAGVAWHRFLGSKP